MGSKNTFFILLTSKLNKYDIIPIVFYLTLTGIIIKLVNSQYPEAKDFVFYYTFLTPILVCVFNYKSLQKLYSYGIWFIISIAQVFLHLYLIEFESLNYKRGNAANGLQLIWIFLIIHQIMRVIHVIIVKREYKPIYLYNAGPKILKGDPDYILNAPLSIIFIFLWIYFYNK